MTCSTEINIQSILLQYIINDKNICKLPHRRSKSIESDFSMDLNTCQINQTTDTDSMKSDDQSDIKETDSINIKTNDLNRSNHQNLTRLVETPTIRQIMKRLPRKGIKSIDSITELFDSDNNTIGHINFEVRIIIVNYFYFYAR